MYINVSNPVDNNYVNSENTEEEKEGKEKGKGLE